MSGTPEPALMAFCSLVYSVVAVPALTRLTLTFGYFFSKAATMSLSCGAQAHQVSVVGCCSASSDDALPLGAADEPPAALEPAAAGAELELELEHAASAPARAKPAAAPAMVLAIRERGAFSIDAPFSTVSSVVEPLREVMPSPIPRQGRSASTAAGTRRRP